LPKDDICFQDRKIKYFNRIGGFEITFRFILNGLQILGRPGCFFYPFLRSETGSINLVILVRMVILLIPA
jgi:hypothetical protein